VCAPSSFCDFFPLILFHLTANNDDDDNDDDDDDYDDNNNNNNNNNNNGPALQFDSFQGYL